MQGFQEGIAIVGIGGLFPDAPDLARFWELIKNGKSTAREVPPDRWQLPKELLYNPEVGKLDHLYCTKGCFLAETPQLPELEGMDPLFHLLLAAGRACLQDGRIENLDRNRIGIIIGNLCLPTESASMLAQNWLGRSLEEELLGETAPLPYPSVSPLNRYVAGLPAGLLAQQLGVGGVTNTVDAACASSLYAIKLAADELLSDRCDAMLAGGVSRPDPLYTQMGFSQLRALSRRGISAPFDADGDGLLTGEGAGIFLLKRLSDAVSHGDRIYGVIRGVGLSNDVDGSLLAPSSEGQLRAMQSAYRQAGWQPQDVDLIECHATGTPVGDAVELASLKQLWQGVPEGKKTVIGSVKSNIGHLLTGAGAAALTKVLLAMQHAVLPPTANFRKPQPAMQLENSPFQILTEPMSWRRRTEKSPFRAAISAFGFGGINAHLLVEEWLPPPQPFAHHPPELKKQASPPPSGKEVGMKGITPEPIAVVGLDATFGPWHDLKGVQQQLLSGRNRQTAAPPAHWYGIQQRKWFKVEQLDQQDYSGWYLKQLQVATNRFRIPPKELEEMQPQQLLMLETAANAMENAGCDRHDNLRTACLIGISFDLNSTNFSLRWNLLQKVPGWGVRLGIFPDAAEFSDWCARLKNCASPPLNANRTMGSLGNIVASRIAREFRIAGPSFTISSEETSGLRAVETAVRLLQQGEIDQALVGAVDLAGDPRCQLHRPAGRFPIGEGAVAMLLKRLDHAVRDNNRIYGLITDATSCNGSEEWPDRLINLLERNQVKRSDIDLVALSTDDTFQPKTVVNENVTVCHAAAELGETGAASGITAALQALLSLYQEIIPANTEGEPPRYWLRNRADTPRQALVSASGVDGSRSALLLTGWDGAQPASAEAERRSPLGACHEQLFPLMAKSGDELLAELDLLQQRLRAADENLPGLASEYCRRGAMNEGKGWQIFLLASNSDQLEELIGYGRESVRQGVIPENLPIHLRERLFYCNTSSALSGKIAFVFPGSGNHYHDMGRELLTTWPEILRRQDRENQRLKDQFQPELFWRSNRPDEINQNHRAVIFGQVAIGCAISDLVRSFGLEPDAFIGYSLGESAALFASRSWHERDLMYQRMLESTLFTDDLAGECRAAKAAWRLDDTEKVDWSLGVVMAPAEKVRQTIQSMQSAVPPPTPPLPFPPPFRVYLLIANRPDESVIGGDSQQLEELVKQLDAPFFPLHGVTTVHCEVAEPVAKPYHDLHLFETSPPEGVLFYSGAKGGSYLPDRENCAAAILDQALHGIDFPATIESAYADGVRIFLEMGPGNSCSRMINRILEGKAHLARAVCFNGADQALHLLRMLASLLAEKVPLDLSPLCMAQPLVNGISSGQNSTRITIGRRGFNLPQLPDRREQKSVDMKISATTDKATTAPELAMPISGATMQQTTLLQQFQQVQAATIAAHDSFLALNETIMQAVVQAINIQAGLRQGLPDDTALITAPDNLATTATPAKPASAVAFDRHLCMEFAIGKVSRMLGPEFAEVDSFPTRVRLPDEPLMLVDRIVKLEGEPRSMTHGRVVTEHDIFPNAWYLDGGRIPTCIAVEAGQADLFLSGYLGIDFITRGLAVYRLLDAVVTFHCGLPGPGETISYDIKIERFFRQGDTWLLRFCFEATVGGEPLLTMRDGCAGFFSARELEEGRGIVRPLLDPRPVTGVRSPDWQELVPLKRESYSAEQLNLLRQGDLAGCFGEQFSKVAVRKPLTIPGGMMRLVHRVIDLIPNGGRYGLGMIRAEADIHPDDWFITCHFVDDRVMPGTLMYECCMHTLRVLLLRMGWIAEDDGNAVWEPVPGVASRLCCRGQVLETTKLVTYEVAIREIGYCPEPFVLVDALMYADGKPIVEISNMSCRLSGSSKEKLEKLWQGCSTVPLSAGSSKPPIYTKEQILAFSNGKPSEGFGDRYRIFDHERKIARLPGPPFQFMDRVIKVTGEPWQMKPGAEVTAQFDLQPDHWFFAAERQPRMPFCVLLEAALQPCGWLAAYVGSALTSPVDLSFRNLGGTATQYRTVTTETGRLTCSARLTKAVTSGGMIIQEFDFRVEDRLGLIYEGETMFGFFSKEALANQVGIRDAAPYQPTAAEEQKAVTLPYPLEQPYPDDRLRMIDRIDCWIADGGPNRLGYLRGVKQVDPDEWFFKAHFYEDPVTPGSLGLESFLQLLKFAAVERFGWQPGQELACTALHHKHTWLYRGQVVPANQQVTVDAWITSVDEEQKTLTASGFLAVDGKLIYQMDDFTVRVEQAR